MSRHNEINLVLGLNKDNPEQKVHFTHQSMIIYPKHLQGLTNDYLLSGTKESKTKLDLLANFRSEVNFWCRDHCKSIYKIEEIFEVKGIRVYFSTFDDCVAFEKTHDTIVPPQMPDIIKKIYES